MVTNEGRMAPLYIRKHGSSASGLIVVSEKSTESHSRILQKNKAGTTLRRFFCFWL